MLSKFQSLILRSNFCGHGLFPDSILVIHVEWHFNPHNAWHWFLLKQHVTSKFTCLTGAVDDALRDTRTPTLSCRQSLVTVSIHSYLPPGISEQNNPKNSQYLIQHSAPPFQVFDSKSANNWHVENIVGPQGAVFQLLCVTSEEGLFFESDPRHFTYSHSPFNKSIKSITR